MSLSLDLGTEPKGLEVKTYGLMSLPDIRIGDYEISMKDFRYLVGYVMTNTDLIPGDPRIALKEDIEHMLVVEGYNTGGKRFDYGQASSDGVSITNFQENGES